MRTTLWMLAGLISLVTAPFTAPAQAADGTGLAPNPEAWTRCARSSRAPRLTRCRAAGCCWSTAMTRRRPCSAC